MIRRRLFFICRFLAFALLMAVLALWYRSWHGADSVRWGSLDLAGAFEHRNTNVLPFLFSLKVDGRPLRIPDAGMSKDGGRDYLVQLVQPGGERNWKLRVNGKSLRELLPDSSPHTIEMFAAFCERQHEGYAGLASLLFEDPWLRKEPGPQFIVRSEGAKLRWTGKEWVGVKQGDSNMMRYRNSIRFVAWSSEPGVFESSRISRWGGPPIYGQ